MSHTLQIERVLDEMKKSGTGRYFNNEEFNRKSNNSALKKFSKTGDYDFVPDVNPLDFEEEHLYQAALKRSSTNMQQTNYLIQPRDVLQSLHNKTHYKAMENVAQEHGNMKLTGKKFNNEFIEIQESLK